MHDTDRQGLKCRSRASREEWAAVLAAREGLGGRIVLWFGVFFFSLTPTPGGEDCSSEEASWRIPVAE